MHPIFVKIGSFEIHSYAVMFCLAFLTALFLSHRAASAEKINREYLLDIFVIAMIASFFGARLTNIFLNWDLYSHEPLWRTIISRQTGLTFMGGFLLVLAAIIIYCRVKKINILYYLDFLTPFAALGYAITRTGCFLSGCCYGQPTTMPWGVVYPVVDGITRHPTQLYSSASVLIIFFLLSYLKKYKTFDGFIFALFMMFYGVYRFCVEFFRTDEPAVGFMTLGQTASLFGILAGALLFYFCKKNMSKKNMIEAQKNVL